MILVDDHYLAARLSGVLARDESPASGHVATTCAWWWRLSAALAGDRSGALSTLFARVDPALRQALVRTVAGLPGRILILDLRELIPAMAQLAAEHRLNLLAAEAVVAAEVLEASIVLRVDTPKIRQTARARGIPYRLV